MATKFFGQYLLEKSLINKDQLLSALDEQRRLNPKIGELAVSEGYLDEAQAKKINQRQKAEDARFGDLALNMKFMTEEQLNTLIDKQAGTRKFFGEILVDLGYIQREVLVSELNTHKQEQKELEHSAQLKIAEHPDAHCINLLADIVGKLFTRILGVPATFCGLTLSEDLKISASRFTHLSSISIESNLDTTLSIACGTGLMHEVASRLIQMDVSEVDEELAWDATGELLNIITGYYAKDSISDAYSYKAKPPVFSNKLESLTEIYQTVIGLRMDSELGDFYVLISH